jgi:hypothetical protein
MQWVILGLAVFLAAMGLLAVRANDELVPDESRKDVIARKRGYRKGVVGLLAAVALAVVFVVKAFGG